MLEHLKVDILMLGHHKETILKQELLKMDHHKEDSASLFSPWRFCFRLGLCSLCFFKDHEGMMCLVLV